MKWVVATHEFPLEDGIPGYYYNVVPQEEAAEYQMENECGFLPGEFQDVHLAANAGEKWLAEVELHQPAMAA